MSVGQMRDLAANSMHSPTIFVSKTNICDGYISIHSQRLMVPSPFIDAWLLTIDFLDICIFCWLN